MQQESQSQTIMTSRTLSSLHRLKRFAVLGAVAWLGACASLPDDAAVVEQLDDQTGLTIARLGRPLELYRENFRKDAARQVRLPRPVRDQPDGPPRVVPVAGDAARGPGCGREAGAHPQRRDARASRSGSRAGRRRPAAHALQDSDVVDRDVLLPHRSRHRRPARRSQEPAHPGDRGHQVRAGQDRLRCSSSGTIRGCGNSPSARDPNYPRARRAASSPACRDAGRTGRYPGCTGAAARSAGC